MPRALFFEQPPTGPPKISPDGRTLAFTRPDSTGQAQVWLQPVSGGTPRQLTSAPPPGVPDFLWAFDGSLLFIGDVTGKEQFQLQRIDPTSGAMRSLTPFPNVEVEIVALSPLVPNEMVVSMNRRRRDEADAYRLDLRTGRLRLLARNPGRVTAWIADRRLRVLAATRSEPEGGGTLLVRSTPQQRWRVLLRWGLGERVVPEGFSEDGRLLYFRANDGSFDTMALESISLTSGSRTTLFRREGADVTEVQYSPRTGQPDLAGAARGRWEWQPVNRELAADLDAITALADADVDILSRDAEDRFWTIGLRRDTAPAEFHLWDRKERRATRLFSADERLSPPERFARVRYVEIPARDGLLLPTYLTCAPGDGPRPCVLLVHGGPWARDWWGFDRLSQWLANRGLAVLQVNFRGSAGFGKAFQNAGRREFGGRMQTDLLDALDWAVRAGEVDPRRVAIMGTSYGGYATLTALTSTPDRFACGVAVAAPSNLVTLVESFPASWRIFLSNSWYAFVGDPARAADRADMESRSPLRRAGAVRVPLLMAHGTNDPRVKQTESDTFVAAVRKAGREVDYYVFPDEGHNISRPENVRRLFAQIERFLGRCLGVETEPPAPSESLEALQR